MKTTFSKSQFSEPFIEMAATLNFEMQNYISQLLAIDKATNRDFDLTKFRINQVEAPARMDVFEAVEY